MRLLEAIIDANHRALAGDASAGLRPAEFAEELPIVALTCIDVRLNALMPQVLGVPGEQFIWLRNAGNIITGPLTSTMRSLALACAIKGGKEIVIIGHTDCAVGRTTSAELVERFRALGIERSRLPDNFSDYFGAFASERANVIKATDFVRQSPLIGPRIPVHGLLVDTQTGKLDWLVNGYQILESTGSPLTQSAKPIGQAEALETIGYNAGEIKFPETKIGDLSSKGADYLTQQSGPVEMKPPPGFPEPPRLPQPPQPRPAETNPPMRPRPGDSRKIPLPPPIKPQLHIRKNARFQ